MSLVIDTEFVPKSLTLVIEPLPFRIVNGIRVRKRVRVRCIHKVRLVKADDDPALLQTLEKCNGPDLKRMRLPELRKSLATQQNLLARYQRLLPDGGKRCAILRDRVFTELQLRRRHPSAIDDPPAAQIRVRERLIRDHFDFVTYFPRRGRKNDQKEKLSS